MKRTLGRRFWIEASFGSATGVLLGATLIWRDWVEAVFKFEPDQQNGSVELIVVAGLAALSAGFFISARAEWLAASMLHGRAVAVASHGGRDDGV